MTSRFYICKTASEGGENELFDGEIKLCVVSITMVLGMANLT